MPSPTKTLQSYEVDEIVELLELLWFRCGDEDENQDRIKSMIDLLKEESTDDES